MPDRSVYAEPGGRAFVGGGGWNAVCCEGMVFRARVQCAERGGGSPGGRADREAAPDIARHCDR